MAKNGSARPLGLTASRNGNGLQLSDCRTCCGVLANWNGAWKKTTSRGVERSPALTNVKASHDSVPIAFLPEIHFYDILAEKLKWRGNGLSTPPKYGHA